MPAFTTGLTFAGSYFLKTLALSFHIPYIAKLI